MPQQTVSALLKISCLAFNFVECSNCPDSDAASHMLVGVILETRNIKAGDPTASSTMGKSSPGFEAMPTVN